jgi:endoglucanase
MMFSLPPPQAARSLTRRLALAGGASIALIRPTVAAEPDVADWLSFRKRFVQPNGRVLDTGNGGQSHTEGQGWTMLFAVRFDDPDTFWRVYAWTQRVLRRPTDALHAWRCGPSPDDRVDDLNNATDGDLVMAWALLEAGTRWNDPSLTEAGTRLASDIVRLLVRDPGNRRVLIPGLRGFEHSDYVVVNPSYYIFPAFPVLAAACPDPAWVEIVAHGLDLLRAAQFGHWGLPPDWLAVPVGAGPLRPAPGQTARFSFDAVRVPLYMAWAGLHSEPGVTGPARFWADPRYHSIPAWIDLTTDETSDYPASPGVIAVARLAMASALGDGHGVSLPAVSQAADYYAAALTLQARLAWHDARLPSA